MRYTATSKTGRKETFNSKRELNFGFFSCTLIDCNKCSHNCKAGVVHFEGASKGKSKSAEICKKMKYEMEIVTLEKKDI